MSEFHLYYQLGLEHILDKNGYDHIVFIVAICALYQLDEWKKVLVLVTAFTIGHSITLALATVEAISIKPDLIEFLIPVTIFITAISNIITKSNPSTLSYRNYFFAGFFGLIHGLGFSTYLKSLLGKDEGILSQLFAFNVGLEVGQIIVVGFFLVAGFLAVSIFGAARRDWRLIVSAAAGGIALMLMIETYNF